jgi:hypothetical protein
MGEHGGIAVEPLPRAALDRAKRRRELADVWVRSAGQEIDFEDENFDALMRVARKRPGKISKPTGQPD